MGGRLGSPGIFDWSQAAMLCARSQPGAGLQDELLGQLIACVQKQWQQLRHFGLKWLGGIKPNSPAAADGRFSLQ